MTAKRHTRTPLDRAQDDLGVATRRLDRAHAAAGKAEDKAKASATEVKEAARAVQAYRTLVISLGGTVDMGEISGDGTGQSLPPARDGRTADTTSSDA